VEGREKGNTGAIMGAANQEGHDDIGAPEIVTPRCFL